MTNNEIIECLEVFLKNMHEVSNEENAVVVMDCKPDSFEWVISETIKALSIQVEEYEKCKYDLLKRYGLYE